MKLINSENKFIYLSVFIHVFLLLLIGVAFQIQNKSYSPIEQNTQAVIDSYFFNEEQTSKSPVQTIQSIQKETIEPHSEKQLPIYHQMKELKTHKLPIKKQLKPNKKIMQRRHQATKSMNSNEHQQTERLVAMLHDQIQQVQIYPLSAMQLQREGRVKVAFILDQFGQVHHVRLIQSSHTQSLDEAAIKAVQMASPFKNVQPYLSAAQEFNIDVVFELS